MRARFAGPAFSVVPFDAAADVYVINTCSVTGRADAQARQLIRRVLRTRPGSRVVVTGCYAQRAPREVAAIPGVALVAGNGEKDRLQDLVAGLPVEPARGAVAEEPVIAVPEPRGRGRLFNPTPAEFGGRTRAYLRVQDGCDAGCSYCVVPQVRGRSVSLDPDLAVRRAEELLQRGFREIVLTGVHLGLFGRDGGGSAGLADLVGRIADLPGEFRLRLSSLEAEEVDGRLIDRMAGDGRLAPQLHLPLQSGSDRVLARMRRPAGAAAYRRVVERAAACIDPLGLGADVIAGFPGETDADFEETVRLIEALPFTYLHVFPWSPRPGTPAAALPGRVPRAVVAERCRRLREMAATRRQGFAQRLLGRPLTVLVEQRREDGAWEGWSGPYVRVLLPDDGAADLRNRFVAVTANEARAGELLAGAPLAASPTDAAPDGCLYRRGGAR